MNVRTLTVRIGALAAPIITALAIGGPSAMATAPELASSTVVVATVVSPTNCGSYTHADYLNVTAAAAGRMTGTIVVCPGTYATLPGPIVIATGANKLTIKAALTGPGSRPYLKTAASHTAGIFANNATSVTIDGLIIDVSAGTVPDTMGIEYYDVSGAIRNTTVIGSTVSSFGIRVANDALPKARNMVVSNNQVLGYAGWGVFFSGQGKLTMTGNLVDGTDGGRVTGASDGVLIQGSTDDIPGPTAAISKNTIMNNNNGVDIISASKVSVSGNTIINHNYGIIISAYDVGQASDNTKISGNTIVGVKFTGILIDNTDAANATIRKTTITGNLIAAARYNGVGIMGVRVQSNLSTPGRVSASISKNTFVGFPVTPGILFISFVNSDVTIGSNVRTP